jgi:tRNA(fMet)-specific endonuclease VapC
VRILDTDTCVEILRGNEAVIFRRESIADIVSTTWINAAELLYGAAKSRSPDLSRIRVLDFLGTLPVIDMNALAADHFGQTKARLENEGRRLADADLFIAATALAHKAVLVTGNLRHYERIANLPIETWTDEE